MSDLSTEQTSLLEDEFSQAFDKDVFDAKAYASQVMEGQLVNEHLKQLLERISLLDRRLHEQISSNHNDLLRQARGVEQLEGVFELMQTRLGVMLAVLEQMRTRIVEPHRRIGERVEQLARMQRVCDLLRTVSRVVHLSKRLRTQWNAHADMRTRVREIAKAAQTVQELDALLGQFDLTGIQLVDAEKPFIDTTREQVLNAATDMFDSGLRAHAFATVSTGAHVLFSLDRLDRTLNALVTDSVSRYRTTLRNAIGIHALTSGQGHSTGSSHGPGRVANLPAAGQYSQLRARFWSGLERCFTEWNETCAQAALLQRALARKYELVRDETFLDAVVTRHADRVFEYLVGLKLQTVKLPCNIDKKGEQKNGREDTPSNCSINLHTLFFGTLKELFARQLNDTLNESNHVRSVLEEEYPKAVRFYRELCAKQFGNVSTPGGSSGVALNATNSYSGTVSEFSLADQNMIAQLVTAPSQFEGFETAYLGKSLSRLFDAVNMMFASTSQKEALAQSAAADADEQEISKRGNAGGNTSWCVPQRGDIDELNRLTSSELLVAQADATLAERLVANVSKAIRLFAFKSDQLSTHLLSTEQLAPLLQPATASRQQAGMGSGATHLQCVALANTIAYFERTFRQSIATSATSFQLAVSARLDAAASEALGTALRSLLQALVDTVFRRAENTLISLHSAYTIGIGELLDLVRRFQLYVAHFDCAEQLGAALQPAFSRFLEVLVVHFALLRRSGSQKAETIVKDLNTLQQLVAQFARRSLPDSERLVAHLDSLKRLFAAADGDLLRVASAAEVRRNVPLSVILLHTLHFRTPADFRTPLSTMSNCSPEQFVRWYFEPLTNEASRIAIVQKCVDQYVRAAQASGARTYFDSYPVVVALLNLV